MRAGLLLLLLGIAIIAYGYFQLEKSPGSDRQSGEVATGTQEGFFEGLLSGADDETVDVEAEPEQVVEKEETEKTTTTPTPVAKKTTTKPTTKPAASSPTTKTTPALRTHVVAQPGTSFIVISYNNNGFFPYDITADPGTTLQFINMITMPLWVTANEVDGFPDQFYPEFDQGKSVPQGGSFSIILYEPGDWVFKNLNNGKHTGVVRIRPTADEEE